MMVLISETVVGLKYFSLDFDEVYEAYSVTLKFFLEQRLTMTKFQAVRNDDTHTHTHTHITLGPFSPV